MFEVIVVDTPTLGDRSYLVHDGTTAFVVDPQRDIDRVLDVAAERGVRVEHILETHVHNDYVTGGYGLARETGALYWLNADDPVRFEGSSRISDGQRVVVSPSLTIRALATPGHTHTHLAFLLEHQGEVVAVFSGGSLLYGSTGRPDLLGPDHTERLVHDQWSTAQRLASLVPAAAALYPTHGFGSFCSASQSDVSASTIGAERASNPVLLLSEAAWVQDVLSGLDAWPAFYAHMAPANLGGPAATDPTPPPFIAPPELQRRAQFGEWVVDLRHRKAFCEAHLAGTIAIGLDGSFATYMGWLVPWGAPVTLLGETANDIAMAQRELSRIGIDRPAAAATGGPDEWARPHRPVALPRATFADLDKVQKQRRVTVVDVRRQLEWASGTLSGSVHIPLHELADRLGELPPGELWVYCQSGYRATIAASLLLRAGRQRVTAIDDALDEAAPSALSV